MAETSIWFSEPEREQCDNRSCRFPDRDRCIPDKEFSFPAHGFGSERQGKQAWAAAEASFWRGSRGYADDECRLWRESDEYIDLGAVALMRRIGSEAFMRRCASVSDASGCGTKCDDSGPALRKPGFGKRALSLCPSLNGFSKKRMEESDSAVTEDYVEEEEENESWESSEKYAGPSSDEYCPQSWKGSRGLRWRRKSSDVSGAFKLNVFSEIGKRIGRLY